MNKVEWKMINGVIEETVFCDIFIPCSDYNNNDILSCLLYIAEVTSICLRTMMMMM